MVLPANAFSLGPAMDPSDLVDYQIDLREGSDPILEPAETMEAFTLILLPEAVALGLEIFEGVYLGDTYATEVIDNISIRAWFRVAEGFRDNAAYLGSGVTLGMELSIRTNSVPSRHRQRTLKLEVAQQ